MVTDDDNLAAALASAHKVFVEGRKNGSNGDGGLAGTCMALVAVISYAAHSVPSCANDLLALRTLLAELGDLHETGRLGQMLKQQGHTRRPGRSKASTEQELLEEASAAAVDVLMRSGESETQANEHVARRLALFWGKAVSGLTVGNWRSAVRKRWGRGKASLYDEFLRDWDKHGEAARARAYVDWLLNPRHSGAATKF